MDTAQPGILAQLPRLARYLSFSRAPQYDPSAALGRLRDSVGEDVVVGLGASLVQRLGRPVEGLRAFPAHATAQAEVPSTPTSLWLWLRGDDRGVLLHEARRITQLLAPAFVLDRVVDAFQHRDSRDLTGYEDGTENPTGDEAITAGFVQGAGAGLDGSSFVAVQQWVHDLDVFQAMSQEKKDHTIGRRLSDNEELEDAPESAHVKRTAQEDFTPEAFIVRRSMPWADSDRAGLLFVAFGRSFDAFEALLSRMVGAEDGVADALFSFTHPITGHYFWCPPVIDGRLDLRAVGLD